MGPRTMAGKNVSPATSTITKMSMATKVGLAVLSVPSPAGAIFLRESDPARARAARIGM